MTAMIGTRHVFWPCVTAWLPVLIAISAGLLLAGCGNPTAQVLPMKEEPGLALFRNYCAACHQENGSGMEGRIPPLDGSTWVGGPDERLIRIVLHGLRGPIVVNGETYEVEMLPFGPILGDEDLASILTHVRRRFGNGGLPISRERVAAVRKETAGRLDYWTAAELLAIPITAKTAPASH